MEKNPRVWRRITKLSNPKVKNILQREVNVKRFGFNEPSSGHKMMLLSSLKPKHLMLTFFHINSSLLDCFVFQFLSLCICVCIYL